MTDLDSYPRPSVAVDTAVLTLAPRHRPSPDLPELQAHVLLVSRDDGWALPGTFVRERERLDDAVMRALATTVGIKARAATQQLAVFDDPYRDDRGWVLSVAHLAVLPPASLEPVLTAADGRLRLAPASRPGPLLWDHEAMVGAAASTLRRAYADRPDPFRLLGSTFTMSALRQVHEGVLGGLLQKDTFRRHMEPRLKATDALATGSVGRPSQVYARRR